jgi:TRAP-type mannitol/chloroaromatic compound transport system permease small subunit
MNSCQNLSVRIHNSDATGGASQWYCRRTSFNFAVGNTLPSKRHVRVDNSKMFYQMPIYIPYSAIIMKHKI